VDQERLIRLSDRHIRTEDEVILPLAAAVLNEPDQRAIGRDGAETRIPMKLCSPLE
jgi:hypothetical protein